MTFFNLLIHSQITQFSVVLGIHIKQNKSQSRAQQFLPYYECLLLFPDIIRLVMAT